MKRLWIALLAALSPTPAAARDIVIDHVAVVDVDKGVIVPDQTVVISGDRIVSVEKSDKAPPSAGATTIDGRGKVLSPGLVDMHVHFAPLPGEPGDAAARAAAVMLAHGVTTARSMAGHPAHVALRDALERGAIPGPRIYAASPAVAENKVKSTDEARAAVRAAKAGGFDLVKSHQIADPAVWQAVQDEAKALGLATAGHVANQVGLDRAFASGQQVEHLDGYPFALANGVGGDQYGQIPPPPVVEAIDPAAIAAHPVFARAREAKSWTVPTLGLFEKILSTEVPTADLVARPEMRFVPPEAARQWGAQREGLVKQLPPAYGAQVIALRRAIVAALVANGLPVMAGSDTAQAFHVWGPALHQEVRALAAAIGPAAALRAATAAPADYFANLAGNGSALGWSADFGRIAPGKRADLVLLEGNPLANLAALDRPTAVIVRGKLFDRAALDNLLSEAERQAHSAK